MMYATRRFEDLNKEKGRRAALFGYRLEHCGYKEGPSKQAWIEGFKAGSEEVDHQRNGG
jgi:hypothetical protein